VNHEKNAKIIHVFRACLADRQVVRGLKLKATNRKYRIVQKKRHMKMDARELRCYRQFYLVYPQIRETLTPEFTARNVS
jgi:hypothetical protein